MDAINISTAPNDINGGAIDKPSLAELKKIADQSYVKKNFADAFDMYQSIADDQMNTDHESAQRVGSMLLEGKSVTKNFHLGIVYLVKAVELGSTKAIAILKNAFNELQAPKNDDYLKNHLKDIVDIVLRGDKNGVIAFGWWAADDKNHLTGLVCHLEDLAKAGNFKAAKILGEWFISSKIPVLENCAINALKATVDNFRHEGHYLLGRVYLLSGDGIAAIDHLKWAHDCRNIDASLLLGKIYGLELCTPILKPIPENHPYPLRRDAINRTLEKATAVLVADIKEKCGLTKPIIEPDWRLAAHYLDFASESGNVEAAFLYGVGLTYQEQESPTNQHIQFAVNNDYPEAVCWLGWHTNNEELLVRASWLDKKFRIFRLSWRFADPRMSEMPKPWRFNDQRTGEWNWISVTGWGFSEFLPTIDKKMYDPELLFLVAVAYEEVHGAGLWRHQILLDTASAGGSFNATLWNAELWAVAKNKPMAIKYLNLADSYQARSTSQDKNDKKEKMGRIMAMHQKYPSIFGEALKTAGSAQQINDTLDNSDQQNGKQLL